ncbi:hypothetical protein JOD31_003438 [Methylopila capsulata]|uniref:Uncharacterized protein n=1 Tax=Methylopila capsulata TaxID=61654 RepID=A0ABS2TAI3_9HYPH|nr:hypothetical protein [Methylopila capsulata]
MARSSRTMTNFILLPIPGRPLAVRDDERYAFGFAGPVSTGRPPAPHSAHEPS